MTGDVALRENPQPPKLLSGLTRDQVQLVLKSAERRTFTPNQLIVSSGNPATNLFQMTTGTAKYFRVTKNGDEVLLWWLSPGDTFGIGALLASGHRYIGTAQAIDACELLVWSHEKIRPLAAAYERLAENALRIVLYYLGTYSDRLVGLTTETAEERLANTLLQLSRRAGRVRSSGVEVAITNDYLSGLANVSTFTASRQLKEWERRGAIRKTRGKIEIFSPESLLPE